MSYNSHITQPTNVHNITIVDICGLGMDCLYTSECLSQFNITNIAKFQHFTMKIKDYADNQNTTSSLVNNGFHQNQRKTIHTNYQPVSILNLSKCLLQSKPLMNLVSLKTELVRVPKTVLIINNTKYVKIIQLK